MSLWSVVPESDSAVTLGHKSRSSIGVDLSADPRNTAAVELEWNDGGAEVANVWGSGKTPLDDACLVTLFDRRDVKIGVDCPFGWPQPFMELMAAQFGNGIRSFQAGSVAAREPFVYRATDLYVMKETENRVGRVVRPLSVSADRIAHVAIRFAGIRSQMQINGSALRDGSGALAEVYPAAALALWNLPYRRYKHAAAIETRRDILGKLCNFGIDPAGHEEAIIASDHVLDALVCAIVAREVDVRGSAVPAAYAEIAKVEGWIHLPEALTGRRFV